LKRKARLNPKPILKEDFKETKGFGNGSIVPKNQFLE
jgi:hypothetical protein